MQQVAQRSCGKAGGRPPGAHHAPIPPNARGRADQPAPLLQRGAECALLVVWTELEPELVACKQRKDVKLEVDEAFAVREEETDAVASGYAVP